jgi:DNA-directed RNA polymerase subunit M/transcription elongation factor TFIIS
MPSTPGSRWEICPRPGFLPSLGRTTSCTLKNSGADSTARVSLKVRDVDRDRAVAALRRARAAAWGDNKDPEEEKDYAILCPKCRSAKVVLEGRDSKLTEPPPTAMFQWRCDACGHQWVDEGILQEVAGGQSWPGEDFPPVTGTLLKSGTRNDDDLP